MHNFDRAFFAVKASLRLSDALKPDTRSWRKADIQIKSLSGNITRDYKVFGA
jgi:hypothetical protein